eukprot:scaffold33495_cov105-Skeletonema_dohrnii-CCMP3373.AAC.9
MPISFLLLHTLFLLPYLFLHNKDRRLAFKKRGSTYAPSTFGISFPTSHCCKRNHVMHGGWWENSSGNHYSIDRENTCNDLLVGEAFGTIFVEERFDGDRRRCRNGAC